MTSCVIKMKIRKVYLIPVIVIVLLIVNSNISKAYVKDQQYLVPLEKEILLNYVNQNCHENHNNWDDLVADGRIKCKPGVKPVSFKTLPFVKHYSSSRSSDINLDTQGWVIVIILIAIFMFFIIYMYSKGDGKPKFIFNITCLLLFSIVFVAAFDLYFNHIAYHIPYSINNIFDAIEENDIGSVKKFVEENSVNPNDYRKTWKHYVKYLPSKRRNRDVKLLYITALDLAVNRRHFEIAEYLSHFTPELNSQYTATKKTLLNSASGTSNYNLVTKILKSDYDKYTRGGTPELTPLHYAVCSNNNDIVRLLIDNNIGNPDQEILFRTPIDSSIWCNNIEAMEMLLEKTNKPRHNPIESALASGNIIAYMKLKMKGFQSDRTLEILTKYQNYHMLNYINSTDEFNDLSEKQISRAISEVIRLQALRGAVFLYKIGLDIDLNLTDRDQSNLLITAAKLQDTEVVKRLIKNGFNKSIKDRFGYTAYDYAVSTKNDDIIDLVKL